MKSPQRVYAALGLALLSVSVTSCAARAAPAATPVVARGAERVAAPADSPAAPEPTTDGVVHVVEPGQTLWRIARVYGVDIESLRVENDIDDPSRIPTGRELKIPGVDAIRDVPPHPAPLPEEKGVDFVLDADAWIWPVPGGEIVSRFGDPRRSHRHAGLDIRGRAGQPVVAARAGRVRYSGSALRGYGKTVILDHGDGTTTLYSHNSELLVREGDEVAAAQEIARVGRSGNATTDHCHFEVRRGDRPFDPLSLFETNAEGTR